MLASTAHLKTFEEKLEFVVHFIATDYYELSHDKIRWQRDDWRKMCQKLLDEQYPATPEIEPNFDDNF